MVQIRLYNILFTLLFFSFLSVSFGQTVNYKYREIGQPLIKYYSPKEYKLSSANWCVLQDKRGVIYFGNENGILEFDGTSWRVIKTPYNLSVRSLAMDDSGRIYVCASSDYGYLNPDSTGQLKFKSLLPYLNKKYRDFGEMWDVITSHKVVYFKTKDKIFRWNGSNIKILDSVFSFRLYKVNDKIYTRNDGTGLMMIEGDSLKLMPDGKYFSKTGVFDMLPFKEGNSNNKNGILVTTNYSGLFLSGGDKFSPFKTEVDSLLKNSQVYNSCITADGNFAFATQRGGVIIIDHKGHLLNIIDENSGLPTNAIYDIYPDKQGGLWLATNNGIVHCETPSPLSILPKKGSLKYPLYSMLRFNGKFYVTNDFGVIYLDKGSDSFKLVKGINKPGYILLDYKGILFAGTNWGLTIIENDKLKKTLIDNSTNWILPSKFFHGRIYVAHGGGLSILQQQKKKKEFDIYKTNFDEELVSIVEDKDSSLWLKSLDGGIIHVTDRMDNLLTGQKNKLHYQRYPKERLPGYKWSLYDIQDKILLATDKGLFRFDNSLKKFVPDSTLGPVLADSTNSILNIIKGNNSDLWILANVNGIDELGKAILQKNGQYVWQPIPVFRRLDLNSITAMYTESDSITKKETLWISTDEELVHYNSLIKKDIKIKYSSLIRKVGVGNDSIIYGGAKPTGFQDKKIILPFSRNDVSFSVSAATFDKPEATLYQYYLEGNDDRWSQWTTEPKKEYTNLSSGDYKFHVRAKNVYGIVSQEDTYLFTVLPAWYLSWWAYIIYALLFILGIFITDRIMRRRIIRKEQERAKLHEAELIKKQAEELETVDKLVRIINNAEDIDTLFNSLLVQTVSFIPKAEKAAVFLLDHTDNMFHIAFTLGYNVDALKSVAFEPDELKKRYTENSDEIEKDIYIISRTEKLFGDEKLTGISKAKSMLIMAVEWDNKLESYVVFDSFAEKDVFDPSTARILNRFREHAVSAISKAQSIKMLQEKNNEIIKTQEQLITQQKLASLGSLTAGIAHEIKNPLNFVNNFALLSTEMIDDLSEVMERDNPALEKEKYLEMKEIIGNLKINLEKINNHGIRADNIVKGMLLHSRGSSGVKMLTDINDLLDQYVDLAFHGMRAQDKDFNITIEKDYDKTLEKIKVVPQDMSRVFLNIINNACYAANEKKRKNGNNFFPTLKVSTKNLQDNVEIRIRDNGNGIPADLIDKIFQPFFTTKPTGEGTGLGLSLSYDIVTKVHGGTITLDSKEGEGSTFTVTLPK